MRTSALKEKVEAEELMRKAEKEWSKPGENSSTAIKGGKRHDQKCQEKREPEVLIILKN